MTPPSSRRRSDQGIRLPLWAFALLTLGVAIFIVGTSIWLFNSIKDLAGDVGDIGPNFGQVAEGSNDAAGDAGAAGTGDGAGGEPNDGAGLIGRWEGKDRVNILVLGIDQRCEEEGPTRTDTMIVLTLDPVGLSAAMLSLPRDLWVDIPGFGLNKINQAHFFGEAYDVPGGGPGLAVKTVENFLGVQLDYFVTINFDGFVQAIDELGGIDVTAAENIADDTYPDNCYGYDPFYLSAGEQHLDGQTALKYARTRATLGGDVDRAARQQQVILAVRDKALSLGMIPQLPFRAPQLWRIFQQNVETDLSLNEAIQLGLLIQDIADGSIRSEVIDYSYVVDQTTPDGQQVLVPQYEQIRALRDQLFAPPAIPTPVIENLPQLMAAEQARIALQNGTEIFGLAGESQTFLVSKGFNVVAIGNADTSAYQATQIIDYGEHRGTTLYLTQLMGLSTQNISNSSVPAADYDVLVILGSDWQLPGSEAE
jgi:LCP family protein required for cell wall assembly